MLTDRRTDRQSNMTKLIGAFRNFSYAPRNINYLETLQKVVIFVVEWNAATLQTWDSSVAEST
jgi:hypothetical protein